MSCRTQANRRREAAIVAETGHPPADRLCRMVLRALTTTRRAGPRAGRGAGPGSRRHGAVVSFDPGRSHAGKGIDPSRRGPRWSVPAGAGHGLVQVTVGVEPDEPPVLAVNPKLAVAARLRVPL